MMKYNFPGDIHFVTFCTFNNKNYFKDEKCCRLFLENLDFYRKKFNLKIYGYCLMPDHVHLLISYDMDKYPEMTISKVMQAIKGSSARQIIDYYKKSGSQEPLLLGRDMEQRLHATQSKGHKRGLKFRVWQPGFYDFNIYSQKKFKEKLNYIHINPIKAGIVNDISKYKYNSWINYEMNNNSIFKIDYLEE